VSNEEWGVGNERRESNYFDNVRFAQKNELMFVVRHETEWSAVKCSAERHSANASSLTTNEM